ncbi:CLUMA_CG003906, isoform A [Clunio marinus]|uniref:CLUMA_CG003906, isoform A n=1 Tax=Clunio marinus TaxID=568069 RepID=A0A1J1HQ53_9DIPT|nr:CLUMA_CG003906, isoform A [Clunio marinus]
MTWDNNFEHDILLNIKRIECLMLRNTLLSGKSFFLSSQGILMLSRSRIGLDFLLKNRKKNFSTNERFNKC